MTLTHCENNRREQRRRDNDVKTIKHHRNSLRLAIVATLSGGLCGPAGAQQGTSPADQREIEQELRELLRMRQELATQMEAFDERIGALEERLDGAPAEAEREPVLVEATSPTSPAEDWGTFQPGRGFVLASNDVGTVNFKLFSYARYLNNTALDDTYTDSFGRTFEIDKRNDVQLAKVNLTFNGWLFDPRFRYYMYTWTSNTSQGDPAQVVVAGNLGYQFSDHFNLYAGIGALPSTRSTNSTFPNWLRNDNRSIADEFFRGSYTSGIWANGMIAPGLRYHVMLGNNLSQLGVNAPQLDDKFNTLSGALWWMPTTGEYGPGSGFGDFEWHDELATLFSINYTTSTENSQAQPGTEGFENSQIRLSDGTRFFSEDPFLTGANFLELDYRMLAMSAGMKYRGWHVEAEAYFRELDNFVTTGPVPINDLSDNGFQIQGSYMVRPKELQVYAGYSRINGDNGDPYDFTLGLNWFPFLRKDMRINVQGLYLKDSPVGYSSVPFIVGGNGWSFSTDAIVAF